MKSIVSLFLIVVFSNLALLQAQSVVSCDKLTERNKVKFLEGSKSPFTGTCVVKNLKNIVIVETNYKNGVEEGLETRWTDEGLKFSEVMFHQGKFNGKAIWYWENGQKKTEDVYVNDYKNGPALEWYANGQKAAEGMLDNCRETGLWTYWYANGQKKAEGEYKAAVKTGEWKYWDEKGNPLKEEPVE